LRRVKVPRTDRSSRLRYRHSSYRVYFRGVPQVVHTATTVLRMGEDESYFGERQITSFGYNLQKPYTAYLRGRINYATFNTRHAFRSAANFDFGYLHHGCYFVSKTLYHSLCITLYDFLCITYSVYKEVQNGVPAEEKGSSNGH